MRLLLKIYDSFKTIIQNILKLMLFFYKITLSPLIKFMFGGGGCRYYPQEKSCSEYAVDVIEKYGIIKGVILATKRIASCNSWSNK